MMSSIVLRLSSQGVEFFRLVLLFLLTGHNLLYLQGHL